MADVRSREVSTRVAANVRTLRRHRRWSVAELVKRLAQVGYVSSQSVLAARESNPSRQSRVTADELVALSVVLEVSLADLVSEQIEVCERCRGIPPAGFACLVCGASGTGV